MLYQMSYYPSFFGVQKYDFFLNCGKTFFRSTPNRLIRCAIYLIIVTVPEPWRTVPSVDLR